MPTIIKKTITVVTKDSSTINLGRGNKSLPVLPEGTLVRVRRGEKSVEFRSGFSVNYQLCTPRGAGTELHKLLAGACSESPVEVVIEILGEE